MIYPLFSSNKTCASKIKSRQLGKWYIKMAVLSCEIVIEQLKATGESDHKMSFKNANLKLCRNEFKDVILHIETKKKELKYRMKDIKVFKKFVNEGKSTIKLENARLQFLLSNCPPDKLKLFLQTLLTKLDLMQIRKVGIPGRERLLSQKQRVLQEISPLSVKDVQSLHEARAKATEKNTVTPKRAALKRKMDVGANGKENQQRNFRCKLDLGVSTAPPLVKLNSNPVVLSKEQRTIFQAALSGKSIFFTGGAGTGKTFLLQRIIGALPPNSTFATASTGAAACHIGGTTLHSFAGIGLGKAPVSQCIELASRDNVAKNWHRCCHLIIDEVSMVDADMLDKLEAVARVLKRNDKPFGGIQLILCGDFLQLPPVSKNMAQRQFAFQAKAWKTCIDLNLELTEVKRQKDKEFVKILNNVRFGRCTQDVYDVLDATSKHNLESSGIQATRLCTHKEHVEQINTRSLQKLPGVKPRLFLSSDSDNSDIPLLDQLCPVARNLELKVGAQVMLCRNMDVPKGLVNGARGVVESFENNQQALPVVKFVCGERLTVQPQRWVFNSGGRYMSRRQLPLKLAWAISIHKSQGMSLDCVEMSLSSAFEFGQAYVALSRCRSLQGLRVVDFDHDCIKANPTVIQFYKELRFTTANQGSQSSAS